MATNGIHYLALDSAKARMQEIDVEYKDATRRLDEAVKEGDLSENSSYEIVKAAVGRLAREREELAPVLSMPVVRANDNVATISDGSVIRLVIYSITPSPVPKGTPEFEALKQAGKSAFDGVLMYGATLSSHELMKDNALSSDSIVGQFLNGKPSGDYSVAVPAGFANLTVEKLHSSTPAEELYCKV